MNQVAKIFMLLLLCLPAHIAGAVQIGQKGLGQALIYPYYTVNNNLNTVYSVVNTTADTKAVKVRFLEGDIGKEVLIFNVYLSAYDVWAGALIPTLSNIEGHVGESSAMHLTFDTTCAPFLVKSGQQFLPDLIDEDIITSPINYNMSRAREGYLEVIEMGVLNGSAAEAADHGTNGIPDSCATLAGAWNEGTVWTLEDLSNPTGGLMGSATIINVGEGIAFPYDAISIENFWDGAGLHTAPGAATPNLSSGDTESKVLLANGELAVSEWATGFEAVSAILMQAEIYNEYAFDSGLVGKSEWVVTYPTKPFHVNQGLPIVAPFTNRWDGQKSCDIYEIKIWDREMQTYRSGPSLPPEGYIPPSSTLTLCASTNVIEFVTPRTSPAPNTGVLRSANLTTTMPAVNASYATENGWARFNFDSMNASNQPLYQMTPVSGTGFIGMPATGFMVQQFTNAYAAEGLLAQYGSLFKHKGLVETTE